MPFVSGTNSAAELLMPIFTPVSNVTYGPDGHALGATDPKGVATRTLDDALGRTLKTIEDYGGANKTTLYTHGNAGMTSLTAVNPGHANQTTAWAYGVAVAAGTGVFDSNDVPRATEHPDPTTGNASTSLEDTQIVDTQGTVLQTTDRNGTVHDFGHDALGRQVLDQATTLGAGVDGSVMVVGTAYDGRGNAYLLTSYDGPAVVNQVENLYNGFGQLTQQFQSANGTVGNATPSVQYNYAFGNNASRLSGIVYPDGFTLGYNYANGTDSAISRLSNLTNGNTTLEGYTYMGLGTVVERNHPSPGLNLSYLGDGHW